MKNPFLAPGCRLLLSGLPLLAACSPTDETPLMPATAEEDPTVAEAPDATAVDGMAAATSTMELPAAAAAYLDSRNEALLLSDVRQLVTGAVRSGEGYFSADGERLIYQAEIAGDNPFYQIFVLDLASGVSTRVSPGVGLTTCAWIHPDGERLLFASTHEDPGALAKQVDEIAIRASGLERAYSWDYDRHYEIYATTGDGLINLTNSDGYDAEGSWSPDGSRIVFASNRQAYDRPLNRAEQALFEADSSWFMDLYIMDADGANPQRLTRSPGYDGGPFFSADGSRVVWRRFNPDGNSAEIWIMDADGTNQRQLTADGMVAWAPYFHPGGAYIIYASNLLGHANFELFIIDTNGNGAPLRVTDTEGTDILPVFSPDGTQLAWSTTRSADGSSQIHLADWNHELALELLGLD